MPRTWLVEDPEEDVDCGSDFTESAVADEPDPEEYVDFGSDFEEFWDSDSDEPDAEAAPGHGSDFEEAYSDGWHEWMCSGEYFPTEPGPIFRSVLHELYEALHRGWAIPIPPERLRMFMRLYPDEFEEGVDARRLD